jgi:hypothetical protein
MADLSASATGRFGGLEQQHVDHPAADERLARSMPGLGGGGARAGAGRRETKTKKATGAAAKSNAQKPVWAREGRHSRFSVQGGIHHPSSIPGATVDAHNHVALWQDCVAGAPVLLTHNVQPTRGIANGSQGLLHSLTFVDGMAPGGLADLSHLPLAQRRNVLHVSLVPQHYG